MREFDPVWVAQELAGLGDADDPGWEERAHADCKPGECQACDSIGAGSGQRAAA